MRTCRSLPTQHTPQQVQIQRHWPIPRRWISPFQANFRTPSRKKAKRNRKPLQKPWTCDNHPNQPPHRKFLRRYTGPHRQIILPLQKTEQHHPVYRHQIKSSTFNPQTATLSDQSAYIYPESHATKNHSTKPNNTTKTP